MKRLSGKTLTRLLAGVAGLVLLVFAVAWACYPWDFRIRHVTVRMNGLATLDEHAAVRTTKAPLNAAGVLIAGARPIPVQPAPPASTTTVYDKGKLTVNEAGLVRLSSDGSITRKHRLERQSVALRREHRHAEVL